jgi:hypothetical protein
MMGVFLPHRGRAATRQGQVIAGGTKRARLAVVMVSAALGLVSAGCGGSPGTRQPATGVPRPASGGAFAGPGRPLPADRTTAAPPASVSPAPGSAPATSPGPAFRAGTAALTDAMRTRMTGVSWHPGCPVSLSQLRLLRLSYWGFDHAVHQGELVVNESAAAGLTPGVPAAVRRPVRHQADAGGR